MARAPGFSSVSVAATASIAPVVLMIGSSGSYCIVLLCYLAVIVAIYALAAVAARFCYVRATPRSAAAGGATAIVVLSLLWCGAGHRLFVYEPMALVLGAVSLAVMLYSEDPSPTWPDTRRAFGASAVAVAVLGGGMLLSWQLQRGFWSAEIFAIGLVRVIVLPLGWSHAICHLAASKWPAGHGWSAVLVRALPGLILTLWPACLLELTRPRLEIGERARFSEPPMVLVELPYLVAAAGLLLARALRRPAVLAPEAVRNAVLQ